MPDQPDPEREMARLDHEAMTAEATERLKHQVGFVDRGLQGLTLINGGALVALIAMLGGNAHLRITARSLWGAFGMFALGLTLALLANFAAYLSQGFYYQVTQFEAWDAQRRMHGLAAERRAAVVKAHRRGQHAEFGGVAAALLSLFVFILGCALALSGVAPR